MSYEATYSSSFDTGLVRQSSANISTGILSLASSIRETAKQGTRMMDEFMNRKIKFPCTIVELKTELKNNILQTVKENSNLTVSQCYMKTIANHPITKNIVANVKSFSSYSNARNLSGIKVFKISENVLNECVSEVEKTFVDVETVLTVQAITKCGWEIIASNYETTSQTIRAQNNEGTVLSVNIQPEKIMMDISGLSGSSCKKHIQNVISELNKLGLEFKLENENEHRKKRGGTLLSFGDSPALISKAAKMKESLKKKKNLSFQTINIHNPTNEIKNSQENKNRERN